MPFLEPDQCYAQRFVRIFLDGDSETPIVHLIEYAPNNKYCHYGETLSFPFETDEDFATDEVLVAIHPSAQLGGVPLDWDNHVDIA